MKRKILLTGMLLFFVLELLHAQQDSLSTRQLILNYKPQKQELITKARAMLTDRFPYGDIGKLAEVINYMDTALEDKGYTVFTLIEKKLLGYWTSNYEYLLDDINKLLEYRARQEYYGSYWSYGEQIYFDDDLEKVMITATGRYQQLLVANIEASSLREDEKDFLALYLKRIIVDYTDPRLKPDSLTQEADVFLKTHPGSPYAEYVRKEIKSNGNGIPNFGIGLAAAPAGGTFLTKELSRSFTNAYTMDITFDFYYKRLACFFRVGKSFGKTKENIPVARDSSVWEKDLRAGPLLVDGSVGYVVLDKKRVTITPFAGISYVKLGPTDNDEDDYPEIKDFKLRSHAYHCGINLDFILRNAGDGDMRAYPFIRLKYNCYFPQFERIYDSYAGMIHNFSVAIGGLMRPGKKKMKHGEGLAQ